MLHEILLSLWGCSTSVAEIIETDPLSLDNYLHPGERLLIEKILGIVRDCNTIRKFIRKNNSVDESKSPLKGLYLTALCDGMDKALEPFRKDIVDMERIVLNDGYTPVSMILCRIQKYLSLFSVLNTIIKEIELQNLHGCKILQCLHHYIHTGVPEIKEALNKMIHCVHVVFYKQLTSWLLYGHLKDVHREFFIQKIDKSCDVVIVDETSKDTDRDKDIIGDNEDKELSDDVWDYGINYDVLPYYITPTLASKILTIGQTIIMFGNDPRQKKDVKMQSKNVESLIWGEKEYEYFEKLKILQAKPTFELIEFTRTVDELKRCVTQHLWHVAVEEAQLINRLKLIKDFYLMGRGDLYLEFVRLASNILDKTPANNTSRDINFAFQMALRKTQSTDEAALDCFTFQVPNLSVSKEETIAKESTTAVGNSEFSDKEREDPIDKRGWGVLILKYKVTWPLHLLFNPSTLENYNTLFRFLLRVKKTQINLWNLWRDHMNLKKIDIDVIQLRNNLIFIVDNLQYYLQVDVIESQYTIMENSMKNTRNFEEVQKAHSVFITNVMSRTFLLNADKADKGSSVNKLIKLLLRLCDDFIRNASVWEIESLLKNEKKELSSLNDVLDGLMSWLTKTLNKVRAQPSGEHLAQLLLRLDFNRWFSSKQK